MHYDSTWLTKIVGQSITQNQPDFIYLTAMWLDKMTYKYACCTASNVSGSYPSNIVQYMVSIGLTALIG